MKTNTKKKIKVNFKFNTFLVFLLLSMLFWMLIKLSKSYTDEVIFNVDYINFPSDKVLQAEPLSSINASIVSSGFNLMSYNLNNKSIQLDLNDLEFNNKQYYYLPNKHLLELKAQLEPETSINSIVQDTIFFKLGANKNKKIPVVLDVDVTFKLGYDYVDKILLSPDSVEISGPELQLDTIKSIKTKLLKLNEVSSDIDEKVRLDTGNHPQLILSHEFVNVNSKVDKFTEGSLKIPVIIKNLPKGYSITTLPDEVTVIYKIGLSNFNKITVDNFKVVCDYNDTSNNNLTYLIPKIEEQSILITSVKVVPNKIEFLIQEKQ